MDKLGGDNFLLSNSERTYNSDGGRIKKSASQRHTLFSDTTFVNDRNI